MTIPLSKCHCCAPQGVWSDPIETQQLGQKKNFLKAQKASVFMTFNILFPQSRKKTLAVVAVSKRVNFLVDEVTSFLILG